LLFDFLVQTKAKIKLHRISLFYCPQAGQADPFSLQLEKGSKKSRR